MREPAPSLAGARVTPEHRGLRVDTVSTADGSLLGAVRDAVGADEVLLAVAFARVAGVQLVRKELEGARARSVRLRVTTAFGTTTPAALGLAVERGVTVRVRNPTGRSTFHPKLFHPKLYLGRSGARSTAVVGSANLTSGLVVNREIAARLRGRAADGAIADSWAWAEAEWARAEPWARPYDEPDEPIVPELLAAIERAADADPVFSTLGRPAPNRVREITPQALYVETDRTRAAGRAPQPVPAWMLNLAWEALHADGRLDNRRLLGELRVHRSSAVLAILARLPGVERAPGRAVGVRLIRRPAG